VRLHNAEKLLYEHDWDEVEWEYKEQWEYKKQWA
jgi:hypothetical protein